MQTGLLDLWQQMGTVAQIVIVLLLFMSVVAIAIGVDRLRVLILPRGKARDYARSLQEHLDHGRFDQAVELDPRGTTPMSRVVSTGLRHYLGVRDEAPSRDELVVSTQATLDRAISAESSRLRRGLGALATIGSTAPFVGLFGTVVGIINSFSQLANPDGEHLDAISAGIAEALVATAVGIMVAVPAVVLFNYFAETADRIETALGEASSAFVEIVRRRGWSGARSEE